MVMRQGILAAIFFGLTATAQASVVEYTFSGTVTSANGIYASAPAGAVVVGTYAFNLDAAIPGQGFGVAGSYKSEPLQRSFAMPQPVRQRLVSLKSVVPLSPPPRTSAQSCPYCASAA